MYFPKELRAAGGNFDLARGLAQLSFNRTFQPFVQQQIAATGGKMIMSMYFDVITNPLPPMIGILTSQLGPQMSIEYSTKSIKELYK
jgi:hypothetical protein